MRVTKLQDYGILFMAKLAQEWKRGPLALSEVASSFDLSPLFLKHVAAVLKKTSLVRSKEGIKGGYFLSRSPQTITMGEIIKALSGGTEILTPGCLLGTPCSVKKCLPKLVWQKISKEILESLDKISLVELVK